MLTSDDLDQVISSEDLKAFVTHANEEVQVSEIQQHLLVDEPGWVRSQFLDRGKGQLRSQFLVRSRYVHPGVADTAYWADVRVDVQHTSGRWMVSDFMFSPGPEEKVLSRRSKRIYMGDQSSWRNISALPDASS